MDQYDMSEEEYERLDAETRAVEARREEARREGWVLFVAGCEEAARPAMLGVG